MHRRLLDHPRQRAVVHAGVGEEVLVLGRQDGVAQDERHLVVGDDPAILPRQLDQHLAAGVVDLADRRELEADEGLEVGQAAPVEVDVVDEPPRREQEQQDQGGSRDAHGAARACRPQNARHNGARGALVLPPGCAASGSPGSVSWRSPQAALSQWSGLRRVVFEVVRIVIRIDLVEGVRRGTSSGPCVCEQSGKFPSRQFIAVRRISSVSIQVLDGTPALDQKRVARKEGDTKAGSEFAKADGPGPPRRGGRRSRWRDVTEASRPGKSSRSPACIFYSSEDRIADAVAVELKLLSDARHDQREYLGSPAG